RPAHRRRRPERPADVWPPEPRRADRPSVGGRLRGGPRKGVRPADVEARRARIVAGIRAAEAAYGIRAATTRTSSTR
ncbi:hypothetical protein AB1399_06315, partial [Hydrogenibacillus schlegelii]|uniref:hypothetical protein n=1 Tax=Hydrogenibacillus schlegelii TaxID=1484 RepID=UPI0034A0351B